MSRFLEYDVSSLIPNHKLICDAAQRVLLLQDRGSGEIVGITALTYSEYRFINVLLRNFPAYSPLEHFLVVLSPSSPEQARALLMRAEHDGTFDTVVRPIRNIITRCRVKLRRLGIEIKSLLLTGYLLCPRPLEHIPTLEPYALDPLFGEKRALLVLDERHKSSILLLENEIVGIERFHRGEYMLVRELAAAFPKHVDYAVMIAVYTGEPREDCRHLFNEAIEGQYLNIAMRPTRNALSRVRVKLQRLGLDIKTLIEMGYVLSTIGRRQ